MRAIAGPLALLSAFLMMSTAVSAEVKNGDKFKDWTVQCETLPPKSAKLDVKVKGSDEDTSAEAEEAKEEKTEEAAEEKTAAVPEGGETICQIVQTLTESSTDQPVLQVAVGHLPGVKTPVAVFNLPLGIWLPPGVQIQVDGKGEAGRVPIDSCDRNGCRAGVELDDKILGLMKAGNELNVSFGSPDRQAVTVPVSLQGFTSGLDALK